MGLQAVENFLANHASDLSITKLSGGGRNCPEVGVRPPELLSKSVLVNAGRRRILIVMCAGDRLDRQKFISTFGTRPKLMAGHLVEMVTGHQAGEISPFGLASRTRVFCDKALHAQQLVSISAGEPGYVITMPPTLLAQLIRAEWVDVSKVSPPEQSLLPALSCLEPAFV